jgi:hypothetical protein
MITREMYDNIQLPELYFKDSFMIYGLHLFKKYEKYEPYHFTFETMMKLIHNRIITEVALYNDDLICEDGLDNSGYGDNICQRFKYCTGCKKCFFLGYQNNEKYSERVCMKYHSFIDRECQENHYE